MTPGAFSVSWTLTQMKRLLILIALATGCFAQQWTLDRLYTRPYVWGTPPQSLTWSKKGHTLVFRWNTEGNRFRDLFAYHPDGHKLVRLTDMESFTDDLLLGEAEKDSRRKLYLPPKAGISDFCLSVDGSKIAFSYKGELFLVPTDGSAPPFRLTRTKASETSPSFSPEGDKLASVRGGQIFIQDLANGQLWQVSNIEASAGKLAAYEWSPDGKQFACLIRKSKPRKMLLPNYSGRFVTANPFPRSVVGDEPPSWVIRLIPASGGKPVEVQMGDWKGRGSISAPVWSKDSTKLAVRMVHFRRKKLRIRVIDAATGASVCVWGEEDPRWIYRSEFGWSPDSKRLWLVSEKDGWAHIYTVPAAGGEAVQVTRGKWEARGEWLSFDFGSTFGPQWVGDFIYYSSTEDGTSQRHLYRIKPDGAGKERLSTGNGIRVGLVSEDGAHIAWQIADRNWPSDLYVDKYRVTARARPEFVEYRWPKVEFIHFPSRGDGESVAAKLLLPPGYATGRKDGKKWPAVFFIHGAGCATSVLDQWGSYQELRYVFNSYLANRGYVIMDLDYRGSTGYGRKWRSDVYLHMGGPDLEDVLGAVDYLKRRGNIDTERLGIWGVSYGGFMTDMAMFLAPNTFQAGSAWASVVDWENYNDGYTRERLNTPAENPEAFRRSSPITFSGLLKNHLLIVHGMVDSNVLFQDDVQLTEKLIQEGKPFGEIYYPEENHGFVRDETWIDACQRTAEWFDRYLK